MPDIFLYSGATPSSDIILRDPTTSGSGPVDTPITPPVGSLVLTGIQGILSAGLYPDVGRLILTPGVTDVYYDGLRIIGYAPTVSEGSGISDTPITPPVGTLTLTGVAGLLGAGILPPAGALTLTGEIGILGTELFPGSGALVLNGAVPIVGGDVFHTPPPGALFLTTFSPTVSESSTAAVRRRRFAKGWTNA